MNQQPRNIQELAILYGVHPATMIRWLKPIRDELLKMNPQPVKRLRFLKANQLKRIFEFLGEA
jgi:transposase